MHADENKINQVIEKAIGAAFRVGYEFGMVFMEKVYENASTYELRQLGLVVLQQQPAGLPSWS